MWEASVEALHPNPTPTPNLMSEVEALGPEGGRSPQAEAGAEAGGGVAGGAAGGGAMSGGAMSGRAAGGGAMSGGASSRASPPPSSAAQAASPGELPKLAK
eukprot:scaffold28536_cov27-Phaeocystis_antarctica.AAC.1